MSVVELSFRRFKIDFCDENNTVNSRIKPIEFDYPCVYGFVLPKDFCVKYPDGYSRTIYIGETQNSGKVKRVSNHFRWIERIFAFRRDLTHLYFFISSPQNVPSCCNLNTKQIEKALLSKFSSKFGDIPIFNKQGGNGEVDFKCKVNKGVLLMKKLQKQSQRARVQPSQVRLTKRLWQI